MTNLNYDKKQKTIIVDTETGGLNPFTNAVCSITIKVLNEQHIKTWYIKPYGKVYDKKAMEINGLSETIKEKGMSPKQVVNEIVLFLKKHVNYNDNNLAHYHPRVIGHNYIFDVQFLNVLFNEFHNRMFTSYLHYHPIDTMILMKGLVESKKIPLYSVSLKNCYKYFFCEDFENQHTSEADVLATEKVYLAYLEFVSGVKCKNMNKGSE